MKNCHYRDGAAVVSFLHWLERRLQENVRVSEVEIDSKLTEYRRVFSPEKFVSPSFDTIAGVNENGAIIHYR